eukprot:CAMPEP_0172406444 /NCGR_PEP_ID=MMETSP1061-20121228/70681_1 /TAXON_ID=37318 /ORGANISM="Pseudo-nitzschia pungens, Strain cf. pungens" /LENGTH=1038 /DNA_ID=CAMNT_0013142041 /DNA_START=70 /DNA_END=3186 /DNA_ORIENTATION=-
MPKKKKKSRASSETTKSNAAEARGTPSSVRNKKSSPTPVSTSKPELISDAISVRLLKGSSPSSSSSTGTKTLKYTPVVTLHETDANKLNVCVGDRVFVLSTTDSSPQRIKSIAIVTVRISDVNSDRTTTPKSSLFGGSGGKNNNHKKNKLTPGNCFLSPVSLAESFSCSDEPEACDSDPKFRIDETPQKASDPSPIEISTPSKPPPSSSSKSKFSFAKGGGGDQLISPSPQKPKPTPSSSSSSKSKFSFAQGGGGDQLISPRATASNTTPSSIRSKAAGPAKTLLLRIVPVDSDLGDSLVSMFCRTAKVLSVGHHRHSMVPGEQESPPSSPESCPTLRGPLHQRLVVAHTCGEYLAQGTPFSVSIRGQRVRCELHGASHYGISKEDEVLIAAMTRLSIDPTTETRDVAIIEPTNAAREAEKSLRASLSLLNDAQREDLLLYEVGPDTNVRFVTDDPPNDSNTTTTTDTNVKKSLPEPNKLKPMVAGLDGTIRQVVSALETPLLHPELFRGSMSHLKPPKGILLHGPSGIGKSSLALQVGENFEATGAYHVERIHCTSLQTQTAFVGQAEARLVQLFARAQKPRPGKKGCLLILDDVHLICPRREGIDLGADRLASTLLALLDGMTNGEQATGDRFYPTVILAITTNPGALDAALRRPGRLDSEIEVPLPDEPSTRLKILRFQLESLGTETHFSDSEWMSLARLAKGFTGADLKLAAKEAVRNTLLSGGDRTVTLPTIRKAILSTKPSAIKAVTVEVPSVPWTSIGGMETVKRQLRDAIELPLTHGATFQRLGIRPPRGVLLYGPPGCSKTLMARALATEGHMNFLAVKGPELLSKWLGESERALAALFRRARLASPAIIFFDEVDAIASKRGGSSNGGGERLLSQLLTELDGIQQNKDSSGREGRVVIVCATNRPDLLDGALMRPGRIDRMIYVGVPDEKSREKILEIGLKKSTGSKIDIARLAKDEISGGLSGAELIGACRDAALKAMEEFEENENSTTDPVITTGHVLATLTNMERQITPENLDFYASFQGNPIRQ